MKALILLLLLSLTLQAQTASVDTATSAQTFLGWEAHAQSGKSASASNYAAYKETLADQAVEIGINRLRVEISIKMENTAANSNSSVNDNSDPFVINDSGFQWANHDYADELMDMAAEMRERLIAQGETLYLVLCYVDFRSGGAFTIEHSSSPDEYAEFIFATFIHMNATYGYVPDAVEILLEPDAGVNVGEWTATKVANSLVAAHDRLATNGWTPRFIIPSTTSCPAADTWYGDIKTALGGTMPDYVDELSYHRYQNCDATTLAQNRDAAQADGNRISMLEYWSTSNDYTVLHQDIGPSGNAVAWQGAAITYPNVADNGGQYFNVATPANTVAIASRSKFYRQYFKWIRRGAVRKATSTTNSNFDCLAFANTGGNYTAVCKVVASGTYTLRGLPTATYHGVYTTASSYNQSLSDQAITTGQDVSVTMPAAGVVTFYADAPAPSLRSLIIQGGIRLVGGVWIRW